MAPARGDRLAAHETLDQVAGGAPALCPEPGLLAQVSLGGLGRNDVDRLDR